MGEVVIKAENLYKEYKLGVISHGTLYRDMQSWLARIKGKEDPNSLISSRHTQKAEKDSFLALDDISFEIKAGDRVGIIGKNGAGKSTLLKILSRITTPTKGTVKIKGRVGSLLEVGTGFHGELTGRENIYLNGAILGMKKHEIDRRLDEIIAFAGIEKHIDTPVKRYSSGMNVRLGFAVAAHLETDILIADEVLAVGDAEFQKKALGKMQDLSTGQGRTILFVSHNIEAVKQLCNIGIVLERGAIKQQTDDILSALNIYLGQNDDKKDKLVHFYNKDYFFDPNFTPLKLEVLDQEDNIQEGSLSFQKTYKIRLEFDIKEYDKALEYWVDIYLNSEKVYYAYADNQVPNLTFHKGINVHELIIPKNIFLPAKTYRVNLVAAIKKTSWILNAHENNISILLPIEKSDLPITGWSVVK